MSSSQRLKVLLDNYGTNEIVTDLIWLVSEEGIKNLTKLNDHFINKMEQYKNRITNKV